MRQRRCLGGVILNSKDMASAPNYHNPSLARRGYFPTIVQPQLTPDEAALLEKIIELQDLIDAEKAFWSRTSASQTNLALADAGAVLAALARCLQADTTPHRLQRIARALRGVTLSTLLKAIRAPVGKTPAARAQQRAAARTKRLQLKNGLVAILHDMWMLGQATVDEAEFRQTAEITKIEFVAALTVQRKAVEAQDVEAEIEDDAIQVDEIDVKPETMYN